MSKPGQWSTPADLRGQLQKRWQRGDILRARLTDEPLFPLTLRLKKPKTPDVSNHFAAVADWVSALRAGARPQKGFGYSIVWRAQRNRVQGSNELPYAVTVDTEDDALRWLGRQQATEQFSQLTEQTLQRFAALRPWLVKRPMKLLEYADIWPDILTVLDWFAAHPRPGVYLRELDIPGIHTKFIERHRGLLSELLDLLLSPQAIDASATGVRGFNRRYGLRDKPVQLRMRLLDERLAINGLTDIAAPVVQLAQLDPGAATVFITENDINGLAFPDRANSLVMFGLGYAVDVLGELDWLQTKTVYYWGDLDTHGFAILNRLRHVLPRAESLLMDEQTLHAHRAVWGTESASQRFTGELACLTDAEQAVYQTLKNDELAPALRLEQEHIRQSWLLEALRAL